MNPFITTGILREIANLNSPQNGTFKKHYNLLRGGGYGYLQLYFNSNLE